ncbi:hypothetical protein LWI29_004342 [Acer saccharum]|uniref:Trehalose 6-phosphate phosphatase n=1 Tax=Acer saccharum TaxID=4024 RepID=A0AA39TBL1_ACESA|nr:hypothetical protein LWI29_004342 [Acer saccharum]
MLRLSVHCSPIPSATQVPQVKLGSGYGLWIINYNRARKSAWGISIKALKDETNGGTSSFSGSSWKIEVPFEQIPEEHPSALGSFKDMIAVAKGKKLVLFLDYDGTLSPIVNDPDKAFMSDAMRVAVREVANLFPTAIVSGRCIDKVHGFVKLDNVVYAGSHGMDIWTPTGSLKYGDVGQQTKSIDEQGNKVVKFQPAQEFLPTVKKIIQVMEQKIKTFKGAMVEDNRFCVSVHYRNVNEKEVDTLKEMVHSTMKAYPTFRIDGGKMVMEIKPSIDWNKGHALEYLLDTFGFTSSSDFLPLYIGDDTTDEDAFEVVRGLKQGIPIIVSSVPTNTKASYSLRDPDEVMDFMVRLAKWKKAKSTA